DPLRLFAVVRSAPEAVTEVEAQRRERHTTQEQAAARHRHWEETERRRLAGRGAAIRRALLWSSPLIALWLLGSLVVRQLLIGGGGESLHGAGRDTDPFALFLALSVLAWCSQCGIEALTAARQGGDYLALGLWSAIARASANAGKGLSGLSKAMSGISRGPNARGRGCLILLAAALPLLLLLVILPAFLAVAWILWIAVMVLMPIAHGIGAALRLHRWRQVHEQARREALGAAT
ncbi:MAG TPA: serine/threonine protein kinase, partial [Actinomadura sp.]|nr:serine/threonine protein kinase [Actinomadura sp.]